MKTKNLKRKQKRLPGGSLKSDCSLLAGEILIVEYGLDKLEEKLTDAGERIQRTRKWLQTVRERISPNGQGQARRDNTKT